MESIELLAAVVLTAGAPAGIRDAFQAAIDDATNDPPAEVTPVTTPIRVLCSDSDNCLGPGFYGTPAFKGIALR